MPKELRAAPATQEMRRKVFERHGYRCVICGRPLTLSNRQTHHPDAHANGGSSDARDLLPYCDECHGSEHQGLLSARWESGEIIPIDANGEPLEKQESPAEVLAASPAAILPLPTLWLQVPEYFNISGMIGRNVRKASGEEAPRVEPRRKDAG
ncbi:MAG TPA: HNH endonuclease signature motif containing protein [Planctomycetota bacterium]|nr:HNH endonuclease signature motif containing protein [Planctomycetota bacterium]